MWWRIKNALYRLARPSFWIQNERTSYEWDKRLNELLDEHEPVGMNGYTVELGGFNIWVKNWPYQYGDHYLGCAAGPLPAPLTRQRLRRIVDAM